MEVKTILLIIQIIYVTTAIGAMFVVILENRNPVKTIAWVLVLLFLPIVGLIFYYYLGGNNRKKRLISKKTYKKIYNIGLQNLKTTDTSLFNSHFKGLINSILPASYLYAGTKVDFFNSCSEAFLDILDKIKQAKHHIHIEYYIFMDDKIGNLFSQLLIEKSKQGVEVRILYDDVGSWKTRKAFFKNLENNGVQVKPFLPVKLKWIIGKVNYRNHKKIIIIDGEIGYLGGMNISDRYVEGLKFGIWRDSQIILEGLAVAALQTSFLLDWHSMTGLILADKEYYPRLDNMGDAHVQIVNGSPFGIDKWIHIGVLNAINMAKKSIYIQTPYFIPTESLLQSLQLAARKGIDVKLMLPEKSDTIFVHISSKSFIESLLIYDIEVYFFKFGFLHSKIMIIDDELTVTGSANMDIRSFETNFEINAFIYDYTTTQKAKKIFYNDLVNCEKIIYKTWKNRKFINKLMSSITRLLSPLL